MRTRKPPVSTTPEPFVGDDDDYYEDEIEEVRPRWQMRGRPYRERDRDYYDKRYNRDRDRPYR